MAAPRIHHWLVGLLGWGAMNACSLTWDLHLDDPYGACPGVHDGTSPAVCAFWHRYVIPMCVMFQGTRVCIAVSQSSDGEYIAQALHRFGLRTVRGSSSRGGVQVLRKLVQLAGEGWAPVLTPDGPRGPRYTVQPGFGLVARRCGLPVRPVGIAVEPARELNSWDRFVVPKFGASIVVHFGRPLEPDDYAGTREFCGALRSALMSADERAADLVR